uniref:Putative plant transposon protein domain-containing protein n=1 Tax=Solanum tuberosum TaxID=4113 RepID=M1DPG3_SOLTU
MKRDLHVVARYWFSLINNTVMPSHNESFMCHSKKACLGAIITHEQINLGMIITSEILMRAKQRQTSLPFSILISEMCRWARVPRDAKKDVEVIPTSSTDIRRIEEEYLKDQAEQKKKTAPVVDTDLSLAKASLPTPPPEPSGIPCVVSSNFPSCSVDVLPPRPIAATVS